MKDDKSKIIESFDFQTLGWKHELWDVVRYFRSIGRNEKKLRELWLNFLAEKSSLAIVNKKCSMREEKISGIITIQKETVELFFDYLNYSQLQNDSLKTCLRTEEQALTFCNTLSLEVGKTTTKNLDHHQSSKALVSSVSHISSEISKKFGLDIDVDPQHRCVWFQKNNLYITARNLDGAIPCLVNPFIVWEIKEYWGKTKGGSKMSDAVYECLLVGRELREYEEKCKYKIYHAVFLDGKEQWSHRTSDFIRFIDMYNQGIIDYLIVGNEIEKKWEEILNNVLSKINIEKK